MLENKIYLDYNGTTPLAVEVIDEISYAMKYLWGNPSSSYDLGLSAKQAINKAREQVANMIEAKSKEIIFTSGGTESNNMLLNSVTDEYYSRFSRKPHFIASIFEHDSISKVLLNLEKAEKINLTKLKISPQKGSIEVDDLISNLTPDTVLVTVMLANNETGIIQPIRQIANAIKHYTEINQLDHKILIHTDAAQAFGKIRISVNDLQVDYMTIVGHKFYGPRAGALYVRDLTDDGKFHTSKTPIRPFILGGGQERDLRSGTENTPMIVGLGKASELVTFNIDKYNRHMTKIRDHLEKTLCLKFKELGFKLLSEFPNQTPRLPNTCCVALANNFDVTGPEILSRCKKLQASVGAACHTSKVTPTRSHYIGSVTLYHCGYSTSDCRSAVRLSVGRETTEADVEAAVEDLYEAVLLCIANK